MQTVPSSEPVRKKSFCSSSAQSSMWCGFCDRTYIRSDCIVVLLTIIEICRLSVRARGVDSDHIVRSGCDQLLAIRSIRQKGRAGGIYVR